MKNALSQSKTNDDSSVHVSFLEFKAAITDEPPSCQDDEFETKKHMFLQNVIQKKTDLENKLVDRIIDHF